MTAGLPRASFGESLRFTLTYLLPSLLKGIAIPMRFWTELATRFERESENQFDCTAHTSGTMTVVVEAAPSWPWQKIRWRWRHWVREGHS